MASAGAACGCSHISIMQLFHQLKQDFPAAPDQVVMQCIWQHAHDKEACERALQGLDGAFLVHAYPSAVSALMTGATRMPMPGAMGRAIGRPLGGPGPGPGLGPSGLVGAGAGPDHAPAGHLGDLPSAETRSPTALHRPPRKMRPAPPPPARPPLPAAAAATPPSTPQRLRPAPPPPVTPPPTSAAGLVNGPSDEVTVNVNCSVSRPGPPPCPEAPPPPPPAPRHTATMDIQPAAPYGVGVVPPRSYTSVNLTLRPPAADQPPIEIHSAGSSLTYTTQSYDPRQGYQSQLQICIGPNGLGSVSAIRTRAPAPAAAPAPATPIPRPAPAATPAPRPPPRRLMSPLAETEELLRRPAASRADLERAVMAMGGAELNPDMREHLVRQLERRTLLETELEKERVKLQMMQREVLEMEKDLERRSAQARPRAPPALPVMEKVQRLRTEIQTLQEECTRMTNEVDSRSPDPRPATGGSSEPGWTCQTCTFRNHYLLEVCEECDVPRIRLGSESAGAQSVPPGLHALRLPGILPSLASPALDAALAPLSLNTNPSALCVPNILTPLPGPGHEE